MTGNPLLDKILMIINGAITLAIIGLVYYSHNMIKPPPIATDGDFKNMARQSISEIQQTPIAFPELIINLYSLETRLRFLNIKMDIDLFDQSREEELKTYKPFILDQLIDLASNSKPQDLNSVTGKLLLQAKLKEIVNKKVGNQLIKQIFFSKFIIQ